MNAAGTKSGYGLAAKILEEHRDRGDAIEAMLEASGGQESDWLEFKAGMALLPKDQKKGDAPEDLYLDYALSVAAMLNTRGGAFVIGVDDKSHKLVSLSTCDPRHVLEKEGWDAYLRKEVLDRIAPSGRTIKSQGHQWRFSASLDPYIESRSIPFQGEKVIGLLVQPCLPGGEITVDWGPNEMVEFLPIRKRGEVGCVKRLKGHGEISSYLEWRRHGGRGWPAGGAELPTGAYSTVEAPCEGRFVGRDAELEQLRCLLEKGKVPVVTGAGGTGKSELVRQYAARHREDYPGGMFQIDMERVADWPEAFLRLLDRPSNTGVRVAECLETGKAKEKRQTREKGQFQEKERPTGEDVREALIRRAWRHGQVLVVLDNVESCEELFGDGEVKRRMFPAGLAEGAKIDVVATARVFDLDPSGGAAEQFPLGDLPLATAVELLLSQHPAGTAEERAAAEQVARLLECRALFLRCVPAIIGAKNSRPGRLICRSYASLAKALETDSLSAIRRTGKVDDLHLPETLWKLTRDTLAGWGGLGEGAVRLVRLAAHFPAEGFPLHVLRRLWDAEVFPGTGEEGLPPDEAFEFVLDACQALHIFQSADPVRIHRLDREAILRDPESDGPELARAVGRALSGYLGASPGIWLSLAAFPDIVRQIPPAVANGSLYARLLSENPALATLCPWETFDCRDWALLLARQPQFGNSCPWEKLVADLDGADWAKLLETSPQFADKCPWDRVKGGCWAALISKQPQFSDRCPWDELDGWDWLFVLRNQPQFAKWCRWEKLDRLDWEALLRSCPQFADKCPGEMPPVAEGARVPPGQSGRAGADSGKKPGGGHGAVFSGKTPQSVERPSMEMMSGRDWADLLSRAPQFADTCPWEKMDGKDWAKLLQKQPQMAVMCPWEKLDGRDWAHLLGHQPQFEGKCPWEDLDGVAWVELLGASLRFVAQCPWKKLDFGLTGLLTAHPQLANHCAWRELGGSAWADLLRDCPQFTDKCPWDTFDGDDWVCLLPWAEEKCPWERLESRHWAMLLAYWPEYADRCPWEKMGEEDFRDLLACQPQFAGRRQDGNRETPPEGG